MKTYLALGIFIALLLGVGGMVMGAYNDLVTLNESIKSSWSEIDNQMQRRADLIPNLVKTVQGYAKHEKTIFEDVAEARAKLAGAKSMGDKQQANAQIDGALSRLLAIAENYPQLKADASFRQLQDELAGTENRIAVARGRYNTVVRDFNVMTQRFPGNLVASKFGFTRKDEYIKADEKAREVPQVQF